MAGRQIVPQFGKQLAAQQASNEDLTVSTFSQSSRNMHVTVEKPAAGYLCTLSMLARVPLGPDRLFDLLVDPVECLRVFTSLKRVHQRRILSDDGAGNRVVEVDQTGAWRFLCFKGSFTVRMIVEQRRADRTINFRLARSGFMKDFTGTWQIRPFDNASLDQMVNRHKPSPLHRLQSSLRAVEGALGLGATQQESLVQLQQSIAPAFAPPKSVAKMLQRIAANQITKIMTDLQAEAQRINSADSSAASGSHVAAGGKAEAAAAAPPPPAPSGPDKGEGQHEGWASRKLRRRRHSKVHAEAEQHMQHAQQQDKGQLAAHIGPLH